MVQKINLTLGARTGAKGKRQEEDFYATHPSAITSFLNRIKSDKDFILHSKIWECACGQGHISEVLKANGYKVFSSDKVDRGYKDTVIGDFLEESWIKPLPANVDILTNPPLKYAIEFVIAALRRLDEGCYACFFLKLQFLESKERKKLFTEYPPKFIYVYSDRQHCAKDGDFETYNCKTVPYCWVIWEKNYHNETVIRWI